MGWNDHMDDSELSNLPAEAFASQESPFEVDDDWLRTADPDDQRTAMQEWFLARYCDPAEETPYNGREGGYLYIHGGPFDPADELPEPAKRTGKERRARRAHGPDARARREVQDDVDDARQCVHVLMAVHMRDGNPRRFDLLELRGELTPNLFEVDAALQIALEKRRVVRQEITL